MSLKGEAGKSFGDQAVHRLVVTVILRPTFAAPGPYLASAAAGLAWSSPHGSLVPFIHSGRCRAESSSHMIAWQGGGDVTAAVPDPLRTEVTS